MSTTPQSPQWPLIANLEEGAALFATTYLDEALARLERAKQDYARDLRVEELLAVADHYDVFRNPEERAHYRLMLGTLPLGQLPMGFIFAEQLRQYPAGHDRVQGALDLLWKMQMGTPQDRPDAPDRPTGSRRKTDLGNGHREHTSP